MMKIAINNWMAGSGKDACADYLVSQHGFKKFALSDGIYKVQKEVFGVEGRDRKLTWKIGEKMREIDILAWINETLRRVDNSGHDRVVITDVRKLLEHGFLRELGWTNIMIYCDMDVALERLRKRDKDVDEYGVINNDLENQLRPLKDTMKTIDNTGDFEETKKELDAYVRYLESSTQDLDFEKNLRAMGF